MTQPAEFVLGEKQLYAPPKTPTLVQVPAMRFLMVSGQGAPESAAYQNAVGVLYAVAYTLKMAPKAGAELPGYQPFHMAPLEGLWDCGSPKIDFSAPTAERARWKWTSLLRLPDFVRPEMVDWARERAAAKKPELDFSALRFSSFEEGLCVHMLHTGPFHTEGESIQKMGRFIEENSLRDMCGQKGRLHHEIYLKDFRRTRPENLKTILRHPVEPI